MTITKFRIGMAALLVLGIAALFAIVGKAQGPTLPPGEYDLETGQYVFNVPELIATDTPIVPPTDTPIVPTDTPIPPTDIPGHSNVDNHPVSASIGHSHNEQDLLEGIFGPPGAWHNGNSISYPWQTWAGLDTDPLGPPQTPLENDFKHVGYKWLTKDLGDNCSESINIGTQTGACITAFRLQIHASGGAVGAPNRLHSFSAELRICTPDFVTCGIMRTGGHYDIGPLSIRHTPGPTFTYIPDPDDPSEFVAHDKNNTPYRHHQAIDELDEDPQSISYQWKSGNKFGWNQMVSFAFSVLDDWQGIDPTDPSRIELFCPDFQCEKNHSLFVVYQISINSSYTDRDQLDDDLDGVVDGVINFSGFTDRQGWLVPDCSPLGPDCIPVILENVPIMGSPDGVAIFKDSIRRQNATEFDISPPGEFWIEAPN